MRFDLYSLLMVIAAANPFSSKAMGSNDNGRKKDDGLLYHEPLLKAAG